MAKKQYNYYIVNTDKGLVMMKEGDPKLKDAEVIAEGWKYSNHLYFWENGKQYDIYPDWTAKERV